jgi:hypothetical protein
VERTIPIVAKWNSEEAVADHPKAANADPKEFFDNWFLKKLEEIRFIQEL